MRVQRYINFSSKFILLLLFFLVVGIALRLFMLLYATTALMWDSWINSDYAVQLMTGHVIADPRDRNLGYSAFLMIVYAFFGYENIYAVQIVQVLLDVYIGIIIFTTTAGMFSKKIASYSFALYMINPYTASYTGMIFSEIFTIFLFCSTAYVISLEQFRYQVRLWILYGFLLGWIIFVRQQFVFFSFFISFVIGILVIPKKKIILFLLSTYISLLVANSYTLYSYWYNYKQISLSPPYNVKNAALYLMFEMSRQTPSLIDDKSGTGYFSRMDDAYVHIVNEYYATPLEQMSAFQDKYTTLFIERLRLDWQVFVTRIIRNVFLIWDKYYLWYYVDEWYPIDKIPVRLGNIVYVGISFLGLLRIWLFNVRLRRHPVTVFSLGMVLYMTIVFSLVSSEPRHTLAYYGICAIWLGYQVREFVQHLPQWGFRSNV